MIQFTIRVFLAISVSTTIVACKEISKSKSEEKSINFSNAVFYGPARVICGGETIKLRVELSSPSTVDAANARLAFDKKTDSGVEKIHFPAEYSKPSVSSQIDLTLKIPEKLNSDLKPYIKIFASQVADAGFGKLGFIKLLPPEACPKQKGSDNLIKISDAAPIQIAIAPDQTAPDLRITSVDKIANGGAQINADVSNIRPDEVATLVVWLSDDISSDVKCSKASDNGVNATMKCVSKVEAHDLTNEKHLWAHDGHGNVTRQQIPWGNLSPAQANVKITSPIEFNLASKSLLRWKFKYEGQASRCYLYDPKSEGQTKSGTCEGELDLNAAIFRNNKEVSIFVLDKNGASVSTDFNLKDYPEVFKNAKFDPNVSADVIKVQN